MEYYALEPFGAERDNIHAGLIASTVANVHISKKDKMLKPADFMLKNASDINRENEQKEKQRINDLMTFMLQAGTPTGNA